MLFIALETFPSSRRCVCVCARAHCYLAYRVCVQSWQDCDTFFHEALRKWQQLNCTTQFSE